MQKWVMSCIPCVFSAAELRQAAVLSPHDKSAANMSSSSTSDLRPRPELIYHINWSHLELAPELLRSTFVQSYCDSGTVAWLQETAVSSQSVIKQTASSVLSKFFGRTTANGLTFRGGMFVFSDAQLATLLTCATRRLNQQQQQQQQTQSAPLSEESSRSIWGPVTFSSPVHNDVLSRYAWKSSCGGNKNKNDKNNGGDDSTHVSNEAASLNSMRNSDPQQQEEQLVDECRKKRLGGRVCMDIGAGDGGVTRHLASFFGTMLVTEDNTVMRNRLQLCYGAQNVLSSEATCPTLLAAPPRVDCVALLNVVDRCERPLSLLKDIRQALFNRMRHRRSEDDASGSLPPVLVLAIVLPFCPFVESGTKQVAPTERLTGMEGGGMCREGASFEQSLDRFVKNVIEPLGFRLLAWTRLPYLSEGDSKTAYFRLDDAVMVLTPAEDFKPS